MSRRLYDTAYFGFARCVSTVRGSRCRWSRWPERRRCGQVIKYKQVEILRYKKTGSGCARRRTGRGMCRAHWPTRAGTKTSECVAQPHLIQFAAVSRLHPGSWNRCFEVDMRDDVHGASRLVNGDGSAARWRWPCCRDGSRSWRRRFNGALASGEQPKLCTV